MGMLGIVGMGPVGKSLAVRARAAGIELVTFDVDPARCETFSTAPDLAALTAACDGVLVAVPVAAALTVAREAAPALRADAPYLDWSSAAPASKLQIAEAAGAERFVDVALLDSITAELPLVCVSGRLAAAAAELLARIGFEVREAGDEPGAAASAKMMRSLFMKPFEVFAIELLRAAHASGSEAAVASVERTLREPFGAFATMLLETNRLHAGRRAHELEEVCAAVAPAGTMGPLTAVRDRLLALEELWSRPGAPPPGADAAALLDFLAQQEGTST